MFARISAELAEAKASLDEILTRFDVTRSLWETAQTVTTRALGAEAMGDGPTPLGDAYAEALRRARDEIAEVPTLTPEAWAELVAAAASEGLRPALAVRGFSVPDYLRLSQHWTQILANESPTAQRYARAFAKAARAAAPSPKR